MTSLALHSLQLTISLYSIALLDPSSGRRGRDARDFMSLRQRAAEKMADHPKCIRVLVVSGSYPPMRCGVGDYTERLVWSLNEYTDAEARVITSVLAGGDAVAGEQPYAHYEVATWTRRGAWTFVKRLRRMKPDVVHIQFPTQGYVLAVAALSWIALTCRYLFRIPVVLTWHEYVPEREPRIRRCMYAMALAADRLVVVRPDYADKLPRPLRIALRGAPVTFIQNISNIPTARLSAEERQSIRERLGVGSRSIVAHFGFVYDHKGTDRLFGIADPSRDHLLIIGELSDSEPYHAKILRMADEPTWQGNVTVTGFVAKEEAARLLATADAVVFPYVHGGGIWNTAIHAVTCQGTFVLASSTSQAGYDAKTNTYYTAPDDLAGMKRALTRYMGVRNADAPTAAETWRALAQAHAAIYRSLVRRG